jgi:hypothetical protein
LSFDWRYASSDSSSPTLSGQLAELTSTTTQSW